MGFKNVEFRQRGVIVDDVFICSDLHIGYSDSINSMTLKDEISDISSKLQEILEKREINKFVLAGDIFDSFEYLPERTTDMYQNMISRIEVEDVSPIAIKGNHDDSAERNERLNIKFRDNYTFSKNKDYNITHGHSISGDDGADTHIIGHLHPVVRINGVEWPTYLCGKNVYKGADIIILPAFSEYQDGVLVSDKLSLDINYPYVEPDDFGDMMPYVYDGENNEVLEFPKLSKSKNHFGL